MNPKETEIDDVKSSLQLLPFGGGDFNIEVTADLVVREADLVEIIFHWNDPHKKIIFGESPIGVRHVGLWQQTCFEAFIQPAGQKKYFEINLTPNKSWNVFYFDDYRMPQPPRELPGAEPMSINVGASELRALIRLPGEDLQKINISLCAVIFLKEAGVTYWSAKHADAKPNFHHFGSFIIERTSP